MLSWVTIAFFILFIIMVFRFAYYRSINTYLEAWILIFIVIFVFLSISETEKEQLVEELCAPVLKERQYLLKSVPHLNSLNEAREHINESIQIASQEFSDSSHNKNTKSDNKIIDAMNHSIKGGKRLRSALMMSVAQESSARYVDSTEMALCLEYLHGASLIIDDMPHFDNDDIRRGDFSTHRKYGAAISQMASTGLTASAMECLVRQGDACRKNAKGLGLNVAPQLMVLISNCSGINGLAGGQLAELQVDSENQLEDIIKRKTGSLFEAAVMSGWIIGTSTWKSPPSEARNKLIKEIANHYGMAFQIADDIEDKDDDIMRGQGDINYCAVHGKSKSIERVREELTECISKLKTLGLLSPIWLDACKLIWV
jgi:geranylgeranyl diphosphate synthase type II